MSRPRQPRKLVVESMETRRFMAASSWLDGSMARVLTVQGTDGLFDTLTQDDVQLPVEIASHGPDAGQSHGEQALATLGSTPSIGAAGSRRERPKPKPTHSQTTESEPCHALPSPCCSRRFAGRRQAAGPTQTYSERGRGICTDVTYDVYHLAKE